MHYDLRKYEETSYNYGLLEKNLVQYKNEQNTVISALFKTYRGIKNHKITNEMNYLGIFMKGLILALLGAMLEFTSPIFINYIVQYVQSAQKDLQFGIEIMVAVGLSRILLALFQVKSYFIYRRASITSRFADP